MVVSFVLQAFSCLQPKLYTSTSGTNLL